MHAPNSICKPKFNVVLSNGPSTKLSMGSILFDVAHVIFIRCNGFHNVLGFETLSLYIDLTDLWFWAIIAEPLQNGTIPMWEKKETTVLNWCGEGESVANDNVVHIDRDREKKKTSIELQIIWIKRIKLLGRWECEGFFHLPLSFFSFNCSMKLWFSVQFFLLFTNDYLRFCASTQFAVVSVKCSEFVQSLFSPCRYLRQKHTRRTIE